MPSSEPRREGREGQEQTGQKLDAAVAEEVMGWVPVWHPDIQLLTWRRPGSGSVIADRNVPAYSSNIAAAWQIVEKLHADGISIHLFWAADFPQWPGESCWQVSAGRSNDTFQQPVILMSVCEAICLAALRAVRGAKQC